MATTQQQQGMHWRDKAIAQASIISDGWQVALAWLGRFAEIILFVSMIIMLANIVIPFPGWFVGGVLVVQMITLDVAAFGLETMASHVKRNGNEEAAKNAETMSKALITIMIITALNVVVDLRFGSNTKDAGSIEVHTITGYVDDVLIFVRIIAVVLYGKTIRSLREVSQFIEITKQDETEALKDQIAQLQQTIHAEQQRALQIQADLQTARDQAAITLQTAGGQSDLVNDLQNQLREALQQTRLATANLNQKQQELDLQNTKLQADTTDLQTAKMQIGDLQNQLQNALSQVSSLTANLDAATAKVQDSSIALQTANQKIADLQNRLQEAKLQTAKPPAHNITSLDQARVKHEVAGSSKAKVSDTEILAFISANPGMKNADIAQKLGISERKIYLAKSAQTANADAVNE